MSRGRHPSIETKLNLVDVLAQEHLRQRLAAEPEPYVPPGLSPRELAVVKLLAEGLTNRVIARRLNISESTAKFHVGNVLYKLGAPSRTKAAIYAVKMGLA